ncbi:response regulator [Lichenihabitans sp. PAMC28606]|uniref:ATP-binding protein n=1 Tax=Lichenihabitans sp. PAMC28606 TaxID=2880932 RepID=UPI001D0A5555|nr:ATP-binding protein [Lichenihabitans sp. PAMC28606]UDL96348.1 response regulator [Lichenihabitans sp. PAMC28606]
MLKIAAAFFGSLTLAWIIGVIGTVLFLHSLLDRARLRRDRRQIDAAQDKLTDDMLEIRSAGEARSRAEASTQAKSRFLATVSHEVRTPLNGILGMAELLGATPLDPEQQAYVDAIHSSGRALTSLIDEVLDLSRIEAGKFELTLAPFEVQALVDDVVELLGPRAQERGLEIAAHVEPGVPSMLVGDAPRLRQVLINLAGNAVKFTEKGGVGVRVAAAADGAFTFTVADTGPGVPADRRSAIFEEFEQGPASRAGRSGGTGLGLSIARRFVGLMDGGLTLSDRPGGGTVFGFTIKLPIADVTTENRTITWPDLKGTTALIVADSPFQAPFLAQNLGAAGARVTIVSSVAQALPLIRADAPLDLLLVDCGLGQEATHRLADASVAAHVARGFLLFSPFERRAFGQKLTAIFDGWLVKPVRARSLATRLAATGDAASVPEAPSSPLAPTPPASVEDLRILLAEDNELNTLVMLKMLDRIGAEVTHVADGAVALNAALAAMRGETKPFDTILLDISMPGLDGQEAARLLRRAEQGAGASPTRIVALTAYAFEDDRQACFDAGIDEFLTKPIDLARLRAALRPAEQKPVGDPEPSQAAI